MDPPINPAKPLRLFELGSDGFQRLCRAMFRELPEVRSAEIYGKTGQAQRGIDIEVTLQSGVRWAVQCKACEKDVRKYLDEAVREFLPHLEFWKEARVEKFIVVFGCGIEDSKFFDKKRQCEQEFQNKGVQLEVWDSSEIRRQLRPMRSVVEQFLPRHYLTEICGSPPGIALSGASEGLLPVSGALIAELGTTHNKRLDDIRDIIRTGNELLAESELRKIPASESWRLLPPNLQARVFRMLASIALNRRRDAAEAESFLAQGRAIDPTGRFVVVEAAITNITKGASAALEEMPSPADRDEWNMRLALLVNAGRAEEALKSLEAPSFEPNAETLRLKSLAHLFVRDIHNALNVAREAEKLAPNWVLVQRALALSEYFLAISPAFEGWRHWTWPLPVPWHLVRSDAEARESLADACQRFTRLAAPEGIDAEDRQEFLAWRLACLANDASKQAEAAALAKHILDDEPTAVAAIAWAVVRDYEFDRRKSEEALEVVCNASTGKTDAVQALFTLIAAENRFEEAAALLDAHREEYARAGLAGPWLFQRAQVSMALGDSEAARRHLEEQSDTDLAARTATALARMGAENTGWTPDVLAKIDAEAIRTGSVDNLFAACEAHYFAEDYAYVIQRAGDLVQRLPTEPALRLVLDACARAKQYKTCLELMEQFQTVFREGVFPDTIRRLRVMCLRGIGRLLEAEQELHLLAEKGGAWDRYELFQLQLSTGRPSEAATTARTLLHEPQITPEGLLHIAEKLRPDEPELAKTFFAQATQKGIDTPEGAAIGMHVGFNLGLDDSITDLIQKAIGSAGEANAVLKPYSLEQILEMTGDWNRKRAELETKYRLGQIPVHGFAHSVRETLATFFHLVLASNESADVAPDRTWSVFARFGANRKPHVFAPGETKKVFFDITTILLAAHIEALPVLESQYAPIGISSWVMECLRDQIERLTSGQPAKIPPKEQVLKLLDDDRIVAVDFNGTGPSDELATQMGERWCALLAYARQREGCLIDFLPLTSNNLPLSAVALSDDLKPFVRGVGDVFQALKGASALADFDLDLAARRLGSNVNDRAGELELDSTKTVVLERGIAELLAGAHLLLPLAERAKVVIGADERVQLQAELSGIANRQNLLQWLRSLRERLRTGLDSGLYAEEPNPEAPSEDKANPVPPEFRCLRDFINENRPASTLTCCDDRMLSRMLHLGVSPVVGLFDLLWELRRDGKIDRQQLFAFQHRLRSANVRYLPPSVEELVFYIRNAKVTKNELIESPELTSLRRYYAACLLDWNILHRLPPNHPDALQRSEILFLPQLQHNVHGALTSLWKDKDIPIATAVSGSDWLLDSLWFDLAALPAFSDPPTAASEDLIGMSEAQLAIEGLSISPIKADGQQNNRRAVYLSWLVSRFGDAPRRLQRLAKELKRFVLALILDAKDEKERKMARQLVTHFLTDLPDSLDSAIHFTNAQLRHLGWRRFSPVSFGDVTFDGATFWTAAQAALRGTPTVVTSSTGSKQFEIASAEPMPALRLSAKDGSSRFRVTEPALALLTSNETKRLKYLQELRSSFDLSQAEAAIDFRKVARKKRVDLMMRDVIELRSNSFVSQLSAVAEGIRSQQRIDMEVARPRGLPPLLRHVRLPKQFKSSDVRPLIDKATAVLLADEGFEEAFKRIGALPISLPDDLLQEFGRLTSGRRDEVVQRLTDYKTPTLRLQSAILLLGGSESEQQQAVKLVAGLVSEENRWEWELFHAILLWTESCLIKDAEKGIGPSPEALAALWTHATGLRESFPSGKVPDDVVTFFRSQNVSPAVGAFDSPASYEYDAASPRRFDVPGFVIGALSHQVDFATLDTSVADSLRDRLTNLAFNTEANLPALELLEQRSTLPNHLGSFMGPPNTTGLTVILGAQIAERFSEATIENDVESYLDQIIADPKLELWVSIGIFLRTNPPTEKQKLRLIGPLSELSFKRFQNPTFEQLQIAAGFIFAYARHFVEVIGSPVWEAKLLELAEIIADRERGYPTEDGALLLGNCAFLLANGISKGADAAANFTRLAGNIASNWPSTASALLAPTIRVLLQQPSDIHIRAWPGVTQIRCAAQKRSSPLGHG